MGHNNHQRGIDNKNNDTIIMVALKPSQLLDNLRRFRYPQKFTLNSIWPANRRAAVLVLLFIGKKGELRVLLTKRSRNLRSFSGHVALPGGKADNIRETFEKVARREAEEEIGLPQDPQVLEQEYGMKLEVVTTELPCYLSQTCLLYTSRCV